MQHKKQVIGIVIFVIILIAIYGAYPLISPLFTDNKVHEEPLVHVTTNDTQSGSSTVSYLKGNFTGFDRIHTGTGTVQVIMEENSHIIRFEPDFSVQNGPDLYVGFGKDGVYIEGSEIAALKGNIGSQNYIVNTKFDKEKYTEVWIWCKRFSEPFARAVLQI